MKLPTIEDLQLEGKKVIVRMDLDISGDKVEGKENRDLFRLEAGLPTLVYLIEKNCKIVVVGHRGRPGGKKVDELSLDSVSKLLEEILTRKLGTEEMKKADLQVMENLRFNPGEEVNDEQFAKHLVEHGDFFVNEAFAASHRKHASVVGLPQFCKSKCKSKNCVAFGFRFAKEIENLSRVFDNSERPVVILISGLKKDKLDYIDPFKKFADKVLIGGRLPEFLGDNTESVREKADGTVVVANLLPDKEDITLHSIEVFEEEVAKAGTIVVSGPIGKFEDEGHGQGTERVFKAVAQNKNAFKVAGGGETEKVISLFGLQDKFDWISVGGGAMLEYLSKKTLPGIKAILED